MRFCVHKPSYVQLFIHISLSFTYLDVTNITAQAHLLLDCERFRQGLPFRYRKDKIIAAAKMHLRQVTYFGVLAEIVSTGSIQCTMLLACRQQFSCASQKCCSRCQAQLKKPQDHGWL